MMENRNKSTEQPVVIFWFRRDLRLHDNTGLYHALQQPLPVLPIFIFDRNILDDLSDPYDRRVDFIHRQVTELQQKLCALGKSLLVWHGRPLEVFQQLLQQWQVAHVYTNRDYEPYAQKRDAAVADLLKAHGVGFHTYKDHVILEANEVLKEDGTPYVVFTPFSKRWKEVFQEKDLKSYPSEKFLPRLLTTEPFPIPSLQQLGFQSTDVVIPPKTVSEELLRNYARLRDFPAAAGTSRMSVHLRFGTVSIRELFRQAQPISRKYVNELIWREFYSYILQHFPRVVTSSFRPDFDAIVWRNRAEEFAAWCEGRTGFPIVDAGMRELNATGYMHNRVRMIVASFLTKHLLIDWRWGEAYFASKLLDYELASNNGGWQWAASCGVDGAPYFRIFNPYEQQRRFDPKGEYVRRWVPELGTPDYPPPIVDHTLARQRALQTYAKFLKRITP
ncbi:MAG: DNA photolyase family protein [Chitinophagales bacterium]|nr:DNA photolyase family protein [Chitinophagales bacterium]MDW8427243.1 deoxyribodipyrimidine photo-lyase [Chitinophagales bacterium]